MDQKSSPPAYAVSGRPGLEHTRVPMHIQNQPWPEEESGCRCKLVSVWSTLTLLLMVLANALFIVAFSTSGWALKFDQGWPENALNYGLWQSCSRVLCNNVPPEDLQDYYLITRGFAVVSIIFHVAAVITSGVYIFVESLRKRVIISTVIAFCFISAVTACACVTIFAVGWMEYWRTYVYIEWYYSYSFGLALGAAFLGLCAGAFGIVDLCGHHNRRKG